MRDDHESSDAARTRRRRQLRVRAYQFRTVAERWQSVRPGRLRPGEALERIGGRARVTAASRGSLREFYSRKRAVRTNLDFEGITSNGRLQRFFEKKAPPVFVPPQTGGKNFILPRLRPARPRRRRSALSPSPPRRLRRSAGSRSRPARPPGGPAAWRNKCVPASR